MRVSSYSLISDLFAAVVCTLTALVLGVIFGLTGAALFSLCVCVYLVAGFRVWLSLTAAALSDSDYFPVRVGFWGEDRHFEETALHLLAQLSANDDDVLKKFRGNYYLFKKGFVVPGAVIVNNKYNTVVWDTFDICITDSEEMGDIAMAHSYMGEAMVKEFKE